MAHGMSLHLGLNAVDPVHYQGWDGVLTACEADAEDMAQIAGSRGFKPTSLLRAKATRKAVSEALTHAAGALKAGDTFFLSYSGHGGQVPDKNGDEDDGADETWCLFDGELIDDELYGLWAKFAAGVRVLVLSDSCHSGSVVRDAFSAALRATGALQAMIEPGAPPPRARAMPRDVALKTYRANRALYDGIQADVVGDAKAKVNASVLLISGCQDNQVSLDGAFNGLFTSNVLRVWRDGKFKGSYRDFHRSVVRRMPPTQTPNFLTVGKQSPAFEAEVPFSLNPG
jgi:hypothetical protein